MTLDRLDPAGTALIVVDLQSRIVALPLGPHTGDEVVAASARLMDRFRAAGAPVVIVQTHRPNLDEQPPGSELVAEAVPHEDELLVTKKWIGAFTGTELHTYLAGQGVGTVVVCGIVTTMGVESTARTADDLGYTVLLPEDAMSGPTAEEHEFALAHALGRFGTVCKEADIAFG